MPDHVCEVCRRPCGFGMGLDNPKWYCREHVPDGFITPVTVKPAAVAPIKRDQPASVALSEPLKPGTEPELRRPRPAERRPAGQLDLF